MGLPPPSPPDDAHLGAFERTGELLGRGGFADVWAARHRATGWQVAIKQPRAETRSALGASLIHEARALARVQHPGVVRILDVLPGDCIAMERATSTAAAWEPASWAEVRGVLLSLLDALADIHSHGLVHRDIKPSNLLLGVRREPRQPLTCPADGLRIADFGIASSELEPAHWPLAGSRTFRAPEQREGRWQAFGPWTDLFAVGRVAGVLCARLGAVPPGLRDWVAWLTAEATEARPDRAIEAAVGLMALGEPRSEAAAPAPPMGSASTTLVHLEPVASPSPSRTEVPPSARPAGTRRLPEDWRTGSPPWPSLALLDAGAGLQHLRRPRLVGREALRDRLWSALHEMARRARPRALALTGPVGIGRRALVDWLAARAHAVGAAEVERVDARHRWVRDGAGSSPLRVEPDGRVRLLVALDVDAASVVKRIVAEAQGPVLGVLARGVAAESWAVPPLSEAEVKGLLRQSLPLVPSLVDHVVQRSGGVPGRVRRWLDAWIAEDRLVPTPEGHAHVDGARPIGRTTVDEGPYADLLARAADGDPAGAWAAFEALPNAATVTHHAVGLDLLEALGAGPDDPRRLHLELLRERSSGIDQGGQWRRMEALARRARGAGADRVRDEIEILLAQWQYTRHGDLEGARERFAAARARIDTRDDPVQQFRACLKSVWPSALLGHHDEAARLADRAAELAPPDRRPAVLSTRAKVLLQVGRPADGVDSCRAGLAALQEGQDELHVHLLLSLGDCQLYAGRSNEAVDAYTSAVGLAAEHGWLELEGIGHNNLGWTLFHGGRLDEAEDHLHTTLDRYQSTNRSSLAARVGLAFVALDRGEVPAARALLDEVEAGETVRVDLFGTLLLLGAAWCAALEERAEAWPDGLQSRLADPIDAYPVLHTVARKTMQAARRVGWSPRVEALERWLSP